MLGSSSWSLGEKKSVAIHIQYLHFVSASKCQPLWWMLLPALQRKNDFPAPLGWKLTVLAISSAAHFIPGVNLFLLSSSTSILLSPASGGNSCPLCYSRQLAKLPVTESHKSTPIMGITYTISAVQLSIAMDSIGLWSVIICHLWPLIFNCSFISHLKSEDVGPGLPNIRQTKH